MFEKWRYVGTFWKVRTFSKNVGILCSEKWRHKYFANVGTYKVKHFRKITLLGKVRTFAKKSCFFSVLYNPFYVTHAFPVLLDVQLFLYAAHLHDVQSSQHVVWVLTWFGDMFVLLVEAYHRPERAAREWKEAGSSIKRSGLMEQHVSSFSESKATFLPRSSASACSHLITYFCV